MNMDLKTLKHESSVFELKYLEIQSAGYNQRTDQIRPQSTHPRISCEYEIRSQITPQTTRMRQKGIDLRIKSYTQLTTHMRIQAKTDEHTESRRPAKSPGEKWRPGVGAAAERCCRPTARTTGEQEGVGSRTGAKQTEGERQTPDHQPSESSG